MRGNILEMRGSMSLNFLRQRLYQDFGMKELIERFYNSIRTGSPPPIPYREIILTARIMDEIFAQIYPAQRRTVRRQTTESEISAGRSSALCISASDPSTTL